MSGPNDKKRKGAIILASAFLLVVVGVAITVGFLSGPEIEEEESTEHSTPSVATTNKAAKAICKPTSYKDTCINSLKNSNSTDPKELIKTGFRAAKKYIAEAAKKSVTLQELEKEPRATEALKNCKYLMDASFEDLERSLKKFADFHKGQTELLLSDLKVWLSAAYTNQETCVDGFENSTSTSGKKMKQALKKVEELISNGLAMVNEIAGIVNHLNMENFSKRRLLGLNVEDRWNPNEELLRRNLLTTKKVKPDLIVAKDGSGKYKTIGEALGDIPKKSKKPFVLYIKAGVYREQIVFDKHMTNLVVIGDGPTKTKITYNKNFVDGTTTFKSASVAVQGDNFIAKDIGFENTAGPSKHQAVALRVGADKAVFYNCQMDGYQDTLYAHTKRQFYRDCTISGTIDFVFGDSAVVFQNCKFLIRKPLDNQQCIVTAQGRKERREASAIIIQNGTITADPAVPPTKDKVKSYLGRPWKVHSRTIIMDSFIDDYIEPEGWMPWNAEVGLSTCFYSEFNNRGPGAVTSRRVKWRGIKSITAEHAQKFTPQIFLLGNHWIPAAGVPYTPGMLSV